MTQNNDSSSQDEDMKTTGSTNHVADNATSNDGDLGADEEAQQKNSSSNEVDTDENESSKAANAIDNPSLNLAGGRRASGTRPVRANEATDRNDSGTGGLSAGGTRSGTEI